MAIDMRLSYDKLSRPGGSAIVMRLLCKKLSRSGGRYTVPTLSRGNLGKLTRKHVAREGGAARNRDVSFLVAKISCDICLFAARCILEYSSQFEGLS
jgi:hypothetical protein